MIDERETPLYDAISIRTARGASIIPSLKAKTLNDLLSESIDEVLTDLLGRKARDAVYDYLARNYSVAREEIPKNLEKFVKLAEGAFGKGSKTIAKCVVKRLFKKLEWKFEDIYGFEFQDYLEAARVRFARELLEKAKANMSSLRLE